MLDLDRLITRFHQFGGMRLVWQYAKMGVLWTGIKEIIRCAIKGKSMKMVYPRITKRVDEILYDKYSSILHSLTLPSLSDKIKQNTHNSEDAKTKVWFCWLQGLDEAPELVHACLKSLYDLPNTEVTIIDKGNYKNYIKFPDYILEKYHKGRIPHATMSDMLRLALLSEHGGIWIDSTVLCTYNEKHLEFWKSIQQSEFYIYRYFRNERINGISTWFIAAKPNNPIIEETLQMMYAYWKDFDCLVEYYLIHLFIGWSAKKHPEYMKMMPKGNSYHAIMLGGALEKLYSEEKWNNLVDHVLFHKMSYRHTEKAKSIKGSYYNHIITEYLA